MTDIKPDWLPDLLCVSPWKNDTYDTLYKLFKLDFLKSCPLYMGKKILIPKEKEYGKEKIFWHLTSKYDKKTGNRIPDLKRAERLLWIKPIIEKAGKSGIKDWDYPEGSNVIKTYVWFGSGNFVVIMKKLNRDRRLLITAYYTDYNNARIKLDKKFRNRIK